MVGSYPSAQSEFVPAPPARHRNNSAWHLSGGWHFDFLRFFPPAPRNAVQSPASPQGPVAAYFAPILMARDATPKNMPCPPNPQFRGGDRYFGPAPAIAHLIRPPIWKWLDRDFPRPELPLGASQSNYRFSAELSRN